MIAGRERRGVRRHGGSLWVPIPRDFAIRMQIESGTDVWVVQPFSDVIVLARAGSPMVGADNPVVSGIAVAICDESRDELRRAIGGTECQGDAVCSVCRALPAAFEYGILRVCVGCERELAACWLHRLGALRDEADIHEG